MDIQQSLKHFCQLSNVTVIKSVFGIIMKQVHIILYIK